jgi:hypothetical protein
MVRYTIDPTVNGYPMEEVEHIGDPFAKLAVAYALNGRTDRALQYFSKSLKRAEGDEAKGAILGFAAYFDEIYATIMKRREEAP